jgi:hypothetical protein
MTANKATAVTTQQKMGYVVQNTASIARDTWNQPSDIVV